MKYIYPWAVTTDYFLIKLWKIVEEIVKNETYTFTLKKLEQENSWHVCFKMI